MKNVACFGLQGDYQGAGQDRHTKENEIQPPATNEQPVPPVTKLSLMVQVRKLRYRITTAFKSFYPTQIVLKEGRHSWLPSAALMGISYLGIAAHSGMMLRMHSKDSLARV